MCIRDRRGEKTTKTEKRASHKEKGQLSDCIIYRSFQFPSTLQSYRRRWPSRGPSPQILWRSLKDASSGPARIAKTNVDIPQRWIVVAAWVGVLAQGRVREKSGLQRKVISITAQVTAAPHLSAEPRDTFGEGKRYDEWCPVFCAKHLLRCCAGLYRVLPYSICGHSFR